MNQQTVIDLGTEAAIVSIKIAAPALVAIMITGFLVSIFQAVTQVNEQTLSFIPKIIAMTIALLVTGPWILQTMIFYTTKLLASLEGITH